MSRPIGRYPGAGINKTTIGDNIDYRNTNKGGYVPRQPVDWDHNISMNLRSFFKKYYDSGKVILTDDIPFKEPLRSEVRRFMISLVAYQESPRPVMPIFWLLMGATEKTFASKLKMLKRESIIYSWNANTFREPVKNSGFKPYKIYSIGDIFNYDYLIFWKTEEPSDYLYGNEDLQFNEETLSKFRSALQRILPDYVPIERDDLYYKSKITSSISYDKKRQKKAPHYQIKNDYLYFAKERDICIRSVIYVGPENIRDSVCVSPDELNTISRIEDICLDILSRMKNHIHLRDASRIEKRCLRLTKTYDHFLHRDLKKEGITKPRLLLRIILEELNKKYPEVEAFRDVGFYDRFMLLVNDNIFLPKRGHGLGMANALTTIMQLAVVEIIDDTITDIYPDFEFNFLTLNDDFVAGFKSLDDCDIFWDEEDDVLQGLGLIREPEKSFVSNYRFVIAERYYDNGMADEKISYQLRELLSPLACYNITHAKELFTSIQNLCNTELGKGVLDRISVPSRSRRLDK